MIQAHFSQIGALLTKYIEESITEICIAVAWFTHRDLFYAILRALDRNVKVSVILIDDVINRGPSGLDFATFVAKGGEIRFVNTRKLLMHNKFCLFDEKILITGSYNWTYSAEMRNAENIIATDEESVCQAFHEQFGQLCENTPSIKHYCHLELNDVASEELLNCFDYLHDEYVYMNTANVLPQNSIIELNVIKQSISHPKAFIQKNLSISLINDQVLPIIYGNKPFEIPFHKDIEICTSVDKQNSIISNIIYGDSIKASENNTICTFIHNNLPQKNAGEVNIRVFFYIDSYLDLHIKSECVINETIGLPSTPTNLREIIEFRQ